MQMNDKTPTVSTADAAFRRGMARELLIHNPDVTDAMEALTLAQELILCSYAWEQSESDTSPQVGNHNDQYKPQH
tara:strand:- start:3925 stop:4149 length:225 start_codon:yes stop_codon:yes gene_type:complete